MKLIFAIVSNDDSSKVSKELTKNRFSVTKLAVRPVRRAAAFRENDSYVPSIRCGRTCRRPREAAGRFAGSFRRVAAGS